MSIFVYGRNYGFKEFLLKLFKLHWNHVNKDN